MASTFQTTSCLYLHYSIILMPPSPAFKWGLRIWELIPSTAPLSHLSSSWVVSWWITCRRSYSLQMTSLEIAHHLAPLKCVCSGKAWTQRIHHRFASRYWGTDVPSQVCHCHTPHLFGLVWVHKRPLLPISWCDYFLGGSPLCWANVLQINMKMKVPEMTLSRLINGFMEFMTWFM